MKEAVPVLFDVYNKTNKFYLTECINVKFSKTCSDITEYYCNPPP